MEITIIIPVKDRRAHIGKTLDSIMKSSCPPKEIIIVDNESTDGTYQFCEQYIKNRSNITLLRETFPGAAAARNKGLKSCKTEWVYFFDSDDLFDYNYIFHMQSANLEGIDVVACPTTMVIDGKEVVRTFIPDNDPRVQMLASVLNTQGMLFRTRFLKDIGAWNTECRIWNDWELGLRLLLPHPSTLVMGGKSSVVIHPQTESITGTDYSSRAESILATIDIADAAVNRFFDENPERTFKPCRERILRLLDYKRMALAGLCEHEHKGSGTALRDKVLAKYAKSSSTRRFIFSLIFDHTATGLRGSYIWAHFL